MKNVLVGQKRKPENGGMAMGTRKQQERQEGFWVATADLPRSAGHPFHERLNELLEEAGFDALVEERCRKFYAAKMGRPSLAPGVYFRLLLIGYFEGLDSERGMAWRAADSLGAAAVSADRAGGDDAGSLDDFADAAADRCGDAPGSVHLGAGRDCGEGIARRQDAGNRRHDTGSECGAAKHCAAGQRGELRGVS